MLLKTNKEAQIGNYMFSVSGGAIGTYGTGIYLPNFMTIVGMNLQGGFLAGAGALVSVGYRTINEDPAFGDPIAFNTAQAAGTFNTTKGCNVVNAMNPFGFDIPLEITVSISVAPLTAGFLVVFVDYFNRDKTVF